MTEPMHLIVEGRRYASETWPDRGEPARIEETRFPVGRDRSESMANAKQSGLWDVELEDAELEQVVVDFLDDAENRAESAKIAKAKKEAFDKHASKFKPGQRVRVGSVHFVVSQNDRDAYTVEPSNAKGMRSAGYVAESAASE